MSSPFVFAKQERRTFPRRSRLYLNREHARQGELRCRVPHRGQNRSQQFSSREELGGEEASSVEAYETAEEQTKSLGPLTVLWKEDYLDPMNCQGLDQVPADTRTLDQKGVVHQTERGEEEWGSS